MLIITIVAGGLLLGFGVGYPLSRVDLDVTTAVELDQVALQGTFDPEAALAQLQDLPGSFAQVEGDASMFGAIGAAFCGQTPEVEGQLGDRLMRAFNTKNGQLVTSEVVRVRKPVEANRYIAEVERTFDGCSQGSFFRTTGDERVEVKIRPGQPDPPVNDYVSYTLQPTGEGTTQRVIFFQVGDVVVALQYFGPSTPPPDVLGKIQTAILERTAPSEFSARREVDGVQPVPTDPTTTALVVTTVAPAAPDATQPDGPPPTNGD
jgi:hypothetical protein